VSYSQPSAPNQGDKFEAHEHKGHLVLVYPKNFQQDIKTTKGLSDAADADIIVVDKLGPDGKPLVFHGARLFGNLARSVKNDIGGKVLGRLDQITSANGNTPWVLHNFTDQDVAMTEPVRMAYEAGQFAQPTNPMQAPAATAPAAPAQWPGQSSAPAPNGAPQQWNPAGGVPAAAPGPSPATAQQYAPPVASTPWPNAGVPAAPQAPGATPSPAPQPAPAPAPTAASAPAPAVDPNLVAFLQARGVTVQPGMDQATCEAIARSFPS